jgi:murein DD-endopeptidase
MQSVDVQVPWAPVPVTVAGRAHLVYELHITNFRPFEVELMRIAVHDPERQGVAFAEFADSKLATMIGTPGAASRPADPQVLRAGTRAVVYLWLPLEASARMPSKLQHRVELDLLRPMGRERVIVETRVSVLGSVRPVVLDPPLRGGPWVGLYDPSMMGGHRTAIYTVDGRARIPARFAIDWIRLDDSAARARGDVTQIANWHGYGAEVLAVADATVAEAMDDIAEDPSIAGDKPPVSLENASGNFVTLDLGGGRFAFYEHLKHGSVRVKPGERVKRGQVIGLLGNSGSSSSGPHLHFHVADTSSHLGAEGVPYVFRNFEVIGAFPKIDTFTTGERWGPVAPAGGGGSRSMELPAANTVVMFR